MDDDEILWEKCWSICWCLYRCRIAGVIGVSRLAKKQEDSLWDLITLSGCALYLTLTHYTLYAIHWIVYTLYTKNYNQDFYTMSNLYRVGKEARGQPVRPHNTLQLCTILDTNTIHCMPYTEYYSVYLITLSGGTLYRTVYKVRYTLCYKHYTLKTTHKLHTIQYYPVCTIYSTYSRPARGHLKRPHRVINCLPAVRYYSIHQYTIHSQWTTICLVYCNVPYALWI